MPVERNARIGAVAAAVGMSVASIQAYARGGRIPSRKTPGRQYRFNIDEVRQLLTPDPLLTKRSFVDLFSSNGQPAVSELSAFRQDPIDANADRRQRMRSVRPDERANEDAAEFGKQSAGRDELSAAVARSTRAATAILHRELTEA